jgi:aspartate kinase
MKVFKFGGASVKDANAVRNVSDIVRSYQKDKLIIIVSAMGKTTNKLEELIAACHNQQAGEFNKHLEDLISYHQNIVDDLFPEGNGVLSLQLQEYFQSIRKMYVQYASSNQNAFYDSMVAFGELLSTRIVEAYMEQSGLKCAWMDASKVIITDDKYRSATVEMQITETKIQEACKVVFRAHKIIVTQGFIGSSLRGAKTTLGREGSDYSGAIFAYCLNAECLTIWKDVEGMYNADPKSFPKAEKLNEISYKDAIELSYYGASVIHPKTIQPLQNKETPLYVKSFLDPKLTGTAITKDAINNIPCYIIKQNQVLVSLSTKNFSFIAEKNLAEIFDKYDQLDMKINIMQNSAVNFSALFDEKQFQESKVLEAFQNSYAVRYNENVELITIRHYNSAIIEELTAGREILLEQRTRETVRFVVRDK